MNKKYFISHFIIGVILLTFTNGCAEMNYNRKLSDDYIYDSEDTYPIPSTTFYEPPELVVIPDTYIYVVPDSTVDIFFYDGWWWRPWNGLWYRSQHYSRGWRHYRSVPHFYRDIPHNWRSEYRNHSWKGHKWNHKRIPYKNFEGNRGEWDKKGYRETPHDRNDRIKPEPTRNDRIDRYKQERDNLERRERIKHETIERNQNNRRERINSENPQQNNNNRHERINSENPQQNNNNRMERIRPERERKIERHERNNQPAIDTVEPVKPKKRGDDLNQEDVQPQRDNRYRNQR